MLGIPPLGLSPVPRFLQRGLQPTNFGRISFSTRDCAAACTSSGLPSTSLPRCHLRLGVFYSGQVLLRPGSAQARFCSGQIFVFSDFGHSGVCVVVVLLLWLLLCCCVVVVVVVVCCVLCVVCCVVVCCVLLPKDLNPEPQRPKP